MDEFRTNYNKGLRSQFKNFRRSVYNLDDMIREKNFIFGYISGGYYAGIISSDEFVKLFHIIQKIYDGALN